MTCASSARKCMLHEFRMLQRDTLRPFCLVLAIAGMKSLSPVTKTIGIKAEPSDSRQREKGVVCVFDVKRLVSSQNGPTPNSLL